MILKNELVTRNNFNDFILPFYNPSFFIPTKGKGSRIWDQKGKEYIDFSGGIAVTSLGHCHPLLNKVLNYQSQKIWHTSNLFTNEPSLRLAKKLVLSSFASYVFFANSGAEANEAAFKLARYYSAKKYHIKKIKLFLFIIHFMVEHYSQYLLVVNQNILIVLGLNHQVFSMLNLIKLKL